MEVWRQWKECRRRTFLPWRCWGAWVTRLWMSWREAPLPRCTCLSPIPWRLLPAVSRLKIPWLASFSPRPRLSPPVLPVVLVLQSMRLSIASAVGECLGLERLAVGCKESEGSVWEEIWSAMER